MMKKVLALMLVLGMASMASATIVDVISVGPGSMGHAGTSLDPLVESETIAIKIVLNADPDPTWYYGGGYTGYDGYWLSSLDVDLHVSGPGTLAEKGTGPAQKIKHNAGFGAWTQSDPLIVDNAIAQLSGVGTGDGIQAAVDLVWNLVIHCEGYGVVTVDLTAGLTELEAGQYSEGPMSWSTPGNPIEWLTIHESDLGDLVIHQIPEPMTIALLGLGGLFLRRRR